MRKKYTYSMPPPTEHETRQQYIDAMLRDAGWVRGRDWLEEVELQGMPNQAQVAMRTTSSTGTTARPWRW